MPQERGVVKTNGRGYTVGPAPFWLRVGYILLSRSFECWQRRGRCVAASAPARPSLVWEPFNGPKGAVGGRVPFIARETEQVAEKRLKVRTVNRTAALKANEAPNTWSSAPLKLPAKQHWETVWLKPNSLLTAIILQ